MSESDIPLVVWSVLRRIYPRLSEESRNVIREELLEMENEIAKLILSKFGIDL